MLPAQPVGQPPVPTRSVQRAVIATAILLLALVHTYLFRHHITDDAFIAFRPYPNGLHADVIGSLSTEKTTQVVEREHSNGGPALEAGGRERIAFRVYRGLGQENPVKCPSCYPWPVKFSRCQRREFARNFAHNRPEFNTC